MSECIHAYTEPEGSNPAYISVNPREGGVGVAVRSAGSQTPQEIVLSREELEKLAEHIYDYLYGEE